MKGRDEEGDWARGLLRRRQAPSSLPLSLSSLSFSNFKQPTTREMKYWEGTGGQPSCCCCCCSYIQNRTVGNNSWKVSRGTNDGLCVCVEARARRLVSTHFTNTLSFSFFFFFLNLSSFFYLFFSSSLNFHYSFFFTCLTVFLLFLFFSSSDVIVLPDVHLHTQRTNRLHLYAVNNKFTL